MLPEKVEHDICCEGRILTQPFNRAEGCAGCITEARDEQWAEWILNRWIPSEGVGDLSREDFESLKKMAGEK